MLKSKKTLALLLVTVVAFSIFVSGCNKSTGNVSDNVKTVTCVDSVGRKVEVPQNPQKIAALDSFTGQAIFVLGAGDKIITTVGGVQRDKLLQAISPKLANASVAMGSGSINAEELLRLKPDVIFVKGSVYATASEKAKLDELGIPYLVIDYTDMKSQMDAMDIIGKAIGKSDKAKEYRKFYEDTISYVKERVKDIPENDLPRIYHSINEAVRTDGPDTLGADWITVTRAINVSVDQPLKYSEDNYFATLEQIYNWNPKIIICNESGVSDYILTDEKWQGLDAVINKTVYQIPIGASRWGHEGSAETPLAILWLAKLLYPDKFKDLDIYQQTKVFYKEFYNYDVSEDTMQSILLGKGLRQASSNALSN